MRKQDVAQQAESGLDEERARSKKHQRVGEQAERTAATSAKAVTEEGPLLDEQDGQMSKILTAGAPTKAAMHGVSAVASAGASAGSAAGVSESAGSSSVAQAAKQRVGERVGEQAEHPPPPHPCPAWQPVPHPHPPAGPACQPVLPRARLEAVRVSPCSRAPALRPCVSALPPPHPP